MGLFEGIQAGVELCNAKSGDLFKIPCGNCEAIFSRRFHCFKSGLRLLDALERLHSFSNRRLCNLRLFLSQLTPSFDMVHHRLERFLSGSRIKFLGISLHGFSTGFERIVGEHVRAFAKCCGAAIMV